MSQDEQFPVGTIVKLKSGGPDMTVQTNDEYGYVFAQWFAGKKLEKGRFPANSLDEIKPDPKSE